MLYLATFIAVILVVIIVVGNGLAAFARPAPTRPAPSRFRSNSQRGGHPEGNTFRNTSITDIDVSLAESGLITVEFDQPVTYKGTPAWVWFVESSGDPPTSATFIAPNKVQFLFVGGTLLGEGSITVPQNEPSIRTRSGGWVAARTYPFNIPIP